MVILERDFAVVAKGLRERVVVFKHALKNAFIPVITVIGIQLGNLIGGSVIIEQIFGLPGVKRQMSTCAHPWRHEATQLPPDRSSWLEKRAAEPHKEERADDEARKASTDQDEWVGGRVERQPS